MKLLMILVPSECLTEVQELVIDHDVRTFTEIPSVLGAGRAGQKLGTRAFPGTSGILMAILPTAEAEKLTEVIRKYAAIPENCDQVAIFSLPAEQVL